jgi:hypothetical protein
MERLGARYVILGPNLSFKSSARAIQMAANGAGVVGFIGAACSRRFHGLLWASGAKRRGWPPPANLSLVTQIANDRAGARAHFAFAPWDASLFSAIDRQGAAAAGMDDAQSSCAASGSQTNRLKLRSEE